MERGDLWTTISKEEIYGRYIKKRRFKDGIRPNPTLFPELEFQKINELKIELNEQLSPIKDKPFVVFHDAYQYFEKSFGLNAVGSIAIGGDIASSPKQISFIKDKIVKLKASCVFQEPQFDSKLIKIVVEGTNAQIGTLDPLGINVNDKENFYLQLLKNMAKSLKDCLG